jgi:hypothetical protein
MVTTLTYNQWNFFDSKNDINKIILLNFMELMIPLKINKRWKNTMQFIMKIKIIIKIQIICKLM